MERILYYIVNEFGRIITYREDPDAAKRYQIMNYPSGRVVPRGMREK